MPNKSIKLFMKALLELKLWSDLMCLFQIIGQFSSQSSMLTFSFSILFLFYFFRRQTTYKEMFLEMKKYFFLCYVFTWSLLMYGMPLIRFICLFNLWKNVKHSQVVAICLDYIYVCTIHLSRFAEPCNNIFVFFWFINWF